ncbi:hypothetical protein AN644_03550 [Candidatus Epulonipiscium fishelsonii]|nr:hypothetical protein AN644_03550 [Epulopiscium sp. SCG-C06WGA-EpuloA1]
MNIGWNFPSNNNGEIIGIGEAGIETFRGSVFNSLAREICQNSLDARENPDAPVRVEFCLHKVPTRNFKGMKELAEALNLCRKFWNKNKKATIFLERALSLCSSETIRVLRISDFNTSGLTGSDKIKSSPWQDLVKSAGVSNKSAESGGSFGIGKFAPYACSELRTIFYSTYDKNGLQACQGVSRLVSFQYPNTNEITQGKGYFGNTEDNSALKTTFSFGGFKRTEVGTDIYILGFANHADWKHNVIKSVIEEYLISIIDGHLEVTIDDKNINKATLEELINTYKEDIPLTYNYYEVLTSKDTKCIIEKNFENMGELELRVLLKPELKRRVLMSRNNGMKVFDQDRISAIIQFAGVCILRGQKLNEYFRAMENPQHTRWEADRFSDNEKEKKEAEKKRKALVAFVKTKIKELGEQPSIDKTDVTSMIDLIQDITASNDDGSDGVEAIKDDIKSINSFKVKKVKKNNSRNKLDLAEISPDIDEVERTSGGSRKKKENKKSNPHTSNGGPRTSKGTDGTGKTGDNRVVTNEFNNENEVEIKSQQLIETNNMRLFISNISDNTYKLLFIPTVSAKLAYIDVVISGESKTEAINIINASTSNNMIKNLLHCKNNKIYLSNIRANRKYTVHFKLAYAQSCAMEVELYEYQV